MAETTGRRMAPADDAHDKIEPETSTNKSIELQIKNAVETLEEDIVFGYLLPRERLIEDDLMERFSLKRHVARQVLIKLQDMGLVERKRNIGAVVRYYTMQEVAHLYEVRVLLETGCVEKIPLPVSKEKLAALTEIQHQHDQAVFAPDLRQAFRINLAFHRALFELSENKILTQAIEDFALRAHIVRSASLIFPELLEKARQDHWKILHCLEAGDRKTLVEVARDHLRPACEAYIRLHRQRISGGRTHQFPENTDVSLPWTSGEAAP